MSKINILSPHVADLIAAGEVVERPASVVKELMENAIDAGASNITVELRRGGLTFIRVTDDGCGMAPEDAGVCFMRHATSKLSDERGLESIGTLGFRGEALAAIAAVSRVSLTTRAAGFDTGVEMEVEAGDIISMRELGCPDGTVMTVRDLFYNTPARLKFMKSDRAESAQCTSVALRCALGHPEVSVRLLRDGREEFFTPGDGKLGSACYAALGRDMAKSLLECTGTGEGVSCAGFISSPRFGRGSRAQQFFFVNGRTIRSLLLQTALENAYKNTLLVGKYPACVLNISLSCAAVDVNVHPTKAEVKFSDEKRVYDAVYYAVLSALERERPNAAVELSPGTRSALAPEPRRPGQTERPAASAAKAEPRPPREEKADWRIMTAEEYGERFLTGGLMPPKKYEPQPERRYRLSDIAAPEAPAPDAAASSAPAVPPAAGRPAPPEPESMLPPEPEFRVIGETMETYILVERSGELIFIDKHAAHERVIFDRLKKSGARLMSQTLLEPQVFRPEAETMQRLLDGQDALMRLGFEVEQYGEQELVIRAIPDSIDAAEAVSALEELSGRLDTQLEDEILHTVACKAAIKAGRSSRRPELEELARRVISGEVKYCPHGRPVSFTLTRRELEKQFRRIV